MVTDNLSQLKDKILENGSLPRHIAIIMDEMEDGRDREDSLGLPAIERALTRCGRWFVSRVSWGSMY